MPWFSCAPAHSSVLSEKAQNPRKGKTGPHTGKGTCCGGTCHQHVFAPVAASSCETANGSRRTKGLRNSKESPGQPLDFTYHLHDLNWHHVGHTPAPFPKHCRRRRRRNCCPRAAALACALSQRPAAAELHEGANPNCAAVPRTRACTPHASPPQRAPQHTPPAMHRAAAVPQLHQAQRPTNSRLAASAPCQPQQTTSSNLPSLLYNWAPAAFQPGPRELRLVHSFRPPQPLNRSKVHLVAMPLTWMRCCLLPNWQWSQRMLHTGCCIRATRNRQPARVTPPR